MPAAISSADYATDGFDGESAGQGIWLCGGDQIPEALLAALCGQVPWAGPDWLGNEAPAPRRGANREDGASEDGASEDGASPDEAGNAGEGASAGDASGTGGVAASQGGVGVEVGFCQGGVLDELCPGPELGLLLPDADDLAGLGDAELTGVIRGWRRLSSWAAAMEHAAVAVLTGRRIGEAGAAGAGESEAVRYAAAEVAAALTLTRCSAEGLTGRAVALAELSATRAALASGVIDMPRALVIASGVTGLDVELCRVVEAQVLVRAPSQTTGELRKSVAQAVFAADPAAAERRLAQAQKSARVERWAEASGTGAIAGRDLPPSDVLAADNRVNALAAALKADGAAGGMDLLRARVFLSLLLNRPLADAAAGGDAPAVGDDASVGGAARAAAAELAADAPVAGGGVVCSGRVPGDARAAGDVAPAGGMAGSADRSVGAAARRAAAEPGPRRPSASAGSGHGLAGSVHLTVPLLTLLGLSDQPGEVAGFGPVTGPVAGRILSRAWDGPGVRWCVTVTDEQGRAAGHGCARPEPAGTDDGWALTVRVGALAVNECAHGRQSGGYVPPASLRHLVQARSQTCGFPGCRRPAYQCDLDHTVAYDRGGRTCECNLAPLCRFHHEVKHRPGWHLEQIRPGVLRWTAPSGWKYTASPGGQPP